MQQILLLNIGINITSNKSGMANGMLILYLKLTAVFACKIKNLMLAALRYKR